MITEPVLCSQPLVGFRTWMVESDGVLHSVVNQVLVPWRTPVLSARCDWHAREREAQPRRYSRTSTPCTPPERECHCGIYAYYEPCEDGLHISGAVVCWGRVVECVDGFRAEHAKIIALRESCLPRGRMDAVADRYGVPVLSADEIVAYGEWWGEVRGLDVLPQP